MCTNWFYIFSAYSRVYVISEINEKNLSECRKLEKYWFKWKKKYICNFKQEKKKNLWREIEMLSLEKENRIMQLQNILKDLGWINTSKKMKKQTNKQTNKHFFAGLWLFKSQCSFCEVGRS